MYTPWILVCSLPKVLVADGTYPVDALPEATHGSPCARGLNLAGDDANDDGPATSEADNEDVDEDDDGPPPCLPVRRSGRI